MNLKELLQNRGDLHTVLNAAINSTESLEQIVERKLNEFMGLIKELHPEARTSLVRSDHGDWLYLFVSSTYADEGILSVRVYGTQAEFRTPYVKIMCFNESQIHEALVLTYRSEEMAGRLKIEAPPFSEEELDDFYEEEMRTHYR